MGPGLDIRHQLRTVDLSTVERHPPIVGSAPFAAPPSAGAALVWKSEEETRAFAERLAAHAALANAFIELRGELGAGKTTLVRHLLRALGVAGRIKSPTYAVVEPYELPGFPVWHFDFYRFADAREWEDAGFRDIFAGPGLKLAEWPENAGKLLPRADLVVRIDAQADESRHVFLSSQTPVGEELLR
jgi:tRNA threonylcarbamoyladenosine biosynthesis protein TsaE